MAIGLTALLDDVAGLAKMAAASLDDAAAQAARAGVKAAGVVIDDAAVTPRYIVGFAAARELPIVGRIALGSLKNKLIYLLPAALALSLLAPWAITPLLMLGGAYLCYEGSEKVYHALRPRHGKHDQGAAGAGEPQAFEDRKVRSAIQTDFILSAEIMAITLGTVPDAGLWTQAIVLAAVGIGITGLVYGGVAIIVKADDVGVALAANARPASGLFGTPARTPTAADRLLRPATQGLGRGLVLGMPAFLRVLGMVGTAAMVWVGGGIIIHGLAGYGLSGIKHAIHAAVLAAGRALPAIAGFTGWAVAALASGMLGLMVGAALIPLVRHVAAPVMDRLQAAAGGSGPPGS